MHNMKELYRARESRARKSNRDKPGQYIERERVARMLREWDMPPEDIAHLTGVPRRRISAIMNGRPSLEMKKNGQVEKRFPCVVGGERYLTLDLVDRLLTGMDQIHLFHLPPEDGGFADVYEHPEIMGAAA